MCPHAQIQRGISFNDRKFADRKIRCILVHDHVLLRQGLRRLLEDEPDMEVVAEAPDAAEALLLVFEHRPEIVIMDARLFGCTPDQAEQLVLRTYANCKVVFLMGSVDAPEGMTCARRQTSAEELAEMVRAAHQGESSAMRMPRKDGLTARESEILKLLAEGRTVRSVAGILGLSVKTVDSHKFNLMRKLGVHNKAELVMSAIQKRVVRVPVR